MPENKKSVKNIPSRYLQTNLQHNTSKEAPKSTEKDSKPTSSDHEHIQTAIKLRRRFEYLKTLQQLRLNDQQHKEELQTLWRLALPKVNAVAYQKQLETEKLMMQDKIQLLKDHLYTLRPQLKYIKQFEVEYKTAMKLLSTQRDQLLLKDIILPDPGCFH